MPDHVSLPSLRDQLAALSAGSADYAVRFVEILLAGGRALDASDIHLLPQDDGLLIKLRLDGLLHALGTFPPGAESDVVSRLKVMSGLLTYRTEVPQEGRIESDPDAPEMRVSTFPTLHGERAVIRMFAAAGNFDRLAELGLPENVTDQLRKLTGETSGALIISGPAGAGKTTTSYALLREIAHTSGGGRSIFSLEDPIETAVAGVAQSRVSHEGPLTYAVGLRSLLRQDPEVIYVGEMRDEPTARIALGAALTGHFLITTFHAGRAAAVLSRLSDMQIEPYVLTSSIRAVLCQWLVRRLCACAEESTSDAERLGLAVDQWRTPSACEACHGTGYSGRMVLAEYLPLDAAIGDQLTSRHDAAAIEKTAVEQGMATRWQQAARAVESGSTSPAEVRRVLGLEAPSHYSDEA